MTIEANGDAYVIKNSAGKYIEHNSGTNFKLADTSSKTWTITYDNDKNWFAIMDVATSTEKTNVNCCTRLKTVLQVIVSAHMLRRTPMA